MFCIRDMGRFRFVGRTFRLDRYRSIWMGALVSGGPLGVVLGGAGGE